MSDTPLRRSRRQSIRKKEQVQQVDQTLAPQPAATVGVVVVGGGGGKRRHERSTSRLEDVHGNSEKKKVRQVHTPSTSFGNPTRQVSTQIGRAIGEASLNPTAPVSTRSNNMRSTLLLDLGRLVRGRLLRRPSSSIRSPYVADVQLIQDQGQGDIDTTGKSQGHEKVVLAHAPALHVGGICLPGAHVLLSERSGTGKTSHVIQLVETTSPKPSLAQDSQTETRAQKAEDDTDVGDAVDGGQMMTTLVGANPQLGERLAERALQLGLLKSHIGFGPISTSSSGNVTLVSRKSGKNEPTPKRIDDYTGNGPSPDDHEGSRTTMTKQVTDGDSRVDFVLDQVYWSDEPADESECVTRSDATAPVTDGSRHRRQMRRRAFIEVKNVVTSDHSIHQPPPHPAMGVHWKITSDVSVNEYKRAGVFPIGPPGNLQEFHGEKVVSARACKHVQHMIGKCQRPRGSNESEMDDETIVPVVLFVVNRSDCQTARACHEKCPVLARLLKEASRVGVQVIAMRVHWESDGKAYFDGFIPVTHQ